MVLGFSFLSPTTTWSSRSPEPGVGIAQMGFPCFVWRQHAAVGSFHACECRLPPQRALWDSTRWRTTRFYDPGCLRACVVSYSAALRQLTADPAGAVALFTGGRAKDIRG